MTIPTALDLQYRLLYLTGLIANETNCLQKKLRLGEECVCEWKDLEILIMMYEVIKQYTFTSTTNCLSIQQIEGMFDYIGNKFNFFFPPYQANYTTNIPAVYEEYRITEDSVQRDIEDGDIRITETTPSTH